MRIRLYFDEDTMTAGLIHGLRAAALMPSPRLTAA